MNFLFYICSIFLIIFTVFAAFCTNPIYALVSLIISFLLMSGIFFSLGAYFPAVLEIIIYAGAIMVLFVFVIMILNLKKNIYVKENPFFFKKIYLLLTFFLSSVLFFIINIRLIYLQDKNIQVILTSINVVGKNLFSNYVLIVEFSSLILLSALIIAFLFGKKNS